MNYLAHLYLAGTDDDLIAGALLGDFVKGRLENLPFPPGIVDGIRLHRVIDAYTDSHPVVVRSRERLQERRRVAGVIVDLAYDHFLAANWHRFSDEPLGTFCHRSYSILLSRVDQYPPRLRMVLPRMASDDWLSAYADLENIGYALERIGSRLRRTDLMLGVIDDLRRHYPGLEQDFLEFFPDLVGHAAQTRLGQSPSRPQSGALTPLHDGRGAPRI